MKSTNLDKWNDEWIAHMKKWGNDNANAYWEANMPSGYKGRVERNAVDGGDKASASTTYHQEQFIRDKYERKKWVGDASRTSPSKSKKKSSGKRGTTEQELNKLRRLSANMVCPDCEGRSD